VGARAPEDRAEVIICPSTYHRRQKKKKRNQKDREKGQMQAKYERGRLYVTTGTSPSICNARVPHPKRDKGSSLKQILKCQEGPKPIQKKKLKEVPLQNNSRVTRKTVSHGKKKKRGKATSLMSVRGFQ